MQEWQEIIKTALIGTERQGLPVLAAEDPVGRLLGRLEATDRERALLRSAGVLACCRRAGYRHVMEQAELPSPAVEEDRPRIASAVTQDLDHMLAGQYQEALADWLAAVAARGQRVPEDRLPDLLELGRRKPELQPAVTGVIGRRGRWLATLRPEWKYATQHSLFSDVPAVEAAVPEREEAERCWQIGTRDERLALLEALRSAEPGAARELVTATWAQDPAEDRALFLETFARGLSLEDEPLLEKALDDRRKEVRQQSAELLARLPDSQLCRRMIERAGPMVQMVPGYGRADTLKVTLPDGVDPAMLRDGIPPKPQQGSGEQTWWAMHILAAVPLSHWCEQFGKTPTEIVAANRSNQWIETLLVGWSRALARYPGPDWAQALLDFWTDNKHTSPRSNLAPWADLLPQFRLEACALRLMQDISLPMTLDHPAAGLLMECRETWGIEVTRAVLERIYETLKGRSDQSYSVLNALERFAPRMSPEAGAESHEMLEQLVSKDNYLKKRLENYYALAQFRFEMMRRIEGGA